MFLNNYVIMMKTINYSQFNYLWNQLFTKTNMKNYQLFWKKRMI